MGQMRSGNLRPTRYGGSLCEIRPDFSSPLPHCCRPVPLPKRNSADPLSTPTISEAVPVPVATGESERFVIRDKQQRIRVDGRVRGGRMEGYWTYFDSKGEKLAVLSYRLHQRHGPAHLYYVTADGPAVGRARMTVATRTVPSTAWWKASGRPGKLERDFDHGMLQGARGWTERGARMSDGKPCGRLWRKAARRMLC